MRVKIPLAALSQEARKLLFQSKEQSLRHLIVVKPQRTLGASWTSDKVAQRKPVVMCEECRRKYDGWWKREQYRADWGWPYVINCDGCSTVGIHGTLFMPEEGFYGVLSNAHGRNPNP